MLTSRAVPVITTDEVFDAVPARAWLAAGVLVLGLVLGFAVGIVVRRLLVGVGVPGTIEGTSFERTAQSLGTSTVDIVSTLSSYFIYGVAILAALTVARIEIADRFWHEVAQFLPQLFFATFVLIVGIVVADKVSLVVAERLRGVKLPQIGIIPAIVKYSIFYLAALIALSQINVATDALIVLLAAYLFALIFFGGIAFKDMLASGATGVYLLLHEPYGIGDEVRVGDTSGIVQEVDLFVTHVESESEEYIIPNRRIFKQGVVRIR
jgi:small-conductance mechanosensitive channel